jgi:hypothetical protein
MSKKTQIAPPATIDTNQRYSLAETHAILRQSPAKTFKDIKAGELRVIREGQRTFVPGSELIRRSRLPDAAAPAA